MDHTERNQKSIISEIQDCYFKENFAKSNQEAKYKKKKVKAVIIKSNKGYKITNNPIEIQRFANEMIVSGMSMMKEGLDFLRLTEKE